MHDRSSDLDELLGACLEQLIARIRLKELAQVLRAMRARHEAEAVGDPVNKLPEDRYLSHALVVGGCREKPEESPLTDDLTRGVEHLDPDVVEVGGAVHGGARVRLRQDEDPRIACLRPHSRWQHRETR